MSGGFIVVAVISLILAGLLLLVVLGFLKLIHDMRMHALKEANQLSNEHFSHLDRFIKDPASPPDLARFALLLSKTSQDKAFGKFATEHLDQIGKGRSAAHSDLANNTMRQLEALESHRPDLVGDFNSAMSKGLFASVYRHLADEMSPLQIYKETKIAKAAETKQNSREATGTMLDWCELA